jgi:hypothetical protein
MAVGHAVGMVLSQIQYCLTDEQFSVGVNGAFISLTSVCPRNGRCFGQHADAVQCPSQVFI